MGDQEAKEKQDSTLLKPTGILKTQQKQMTFFMRAEGGKELRKGGGEYAGDRHHYWRDQALQWDGRAQTEKKLKLREKTQVQPQVRMERLSPYQMVDLQRTGAKERRDWSQECISPAL